MMTIICIMENKPKGGTRRVDYRLTSRLSAFVTALRAAEYEVLYRPSQRVAVPSAELYAAITVWAEKIASDKPFPRPSVAALLESVEADNRGALRVDTKTLSVYDGDRVLY